MKQRNGEYFITDLQKKKKKCRQSDFASHEFEVGERTQTQTYKVSFFLF